MARWQWMAAGVALATVVALAATWWETPLHTLAEPAGPVPTPLAWTAQIEPLAGDGHPGAGFDAQVDLAQDGDLARSDGVVQGEASGLDQGNGGGHGLSDEGARCEFPARPPGSAAGHGIGRM